MDNLAENKELIAWCSAGLCNRLRVLFSSYILAKATNRKFYMVWKKNEECGADFKDLFQNTEFEIDPTGEKAKGCDVKKPSVEKDYFGSNIVSNVLNDKTEKICFYYWGFIINPYVFPEQKEIGDAVYKLIDTLKPLGHIQKKIDYFYKECFNGIIMGVHVRRGDFKTDKKEYTENLGKIVERMDNFLGRFPDGKFFIATDDGAPSPKGLPIEKENLLDFFIKRYPEKVIYYPVRSLDRAKLEAIEDALITLFLLRKTDEFVGNAYSSFSDFATVNRKINCVRV